MRAGYDRVYADTRRPPIPDLSSWDTAFRTSNWRGPALRAARANSSSARCAAMCTRCTTDSLWDDLPFAISAAFHRQAC
jgi:hypothetical protein